MAKFCKKCGSPITPGTKFCKKCGTPTQSVSENISTSQNQPNESVQQNNSSGSSKKIGAIILAVAILAGGGGAAYYFSNNVANISSESEQKNSEVENKSDDKEKDSAEKKSETPAENSAKPEEKKSNSEVKSKKSGPLDAEDLKLGELSIGDSKEKVSKILGNPISTSNAQRQITWKFDAMEVTLNSAGKVTGLVSNFSDVATPRGIMEGMPEKEIFKAYGTEYKDSTYENLRLYEYEIKHTENTSCILRFAVRKTDHRIEYISIRVAD